MERLLPKDEVLRIVGVTYPALWEWMRLGRFPRSVVIGRGRFARVAWRESEVQAWLDSLPRSRLLGDPEEKPQRRRLRDGS